MENLFAMGPGREFVGIHVDGLQASPSEQLLVELKDPQQYDSVDLASDFSPARVSGVVTTATEAFTGTILVAVNEIVQDYLKHVFVEGSNKPRSIKKMLSVLDGIQLPVEDADVLSNVNTPEEWGAAQQLITANANNTNK